MKKKSYTQPTMMVVKIKHQCRILVGSKTYGVDKQLQSDEVNDAW